MSGDPKPTLHVVFGYSAAGSVREALHQIGRDERVIGFADDLSFGPIDRAEERSSWVADELGYDWDGVCAKADAFWAEVLSPTVTPVAWVCRNHALEYAGFLEFVWRMGEAPFDAIDASEVECPPRRVLWSLGILKPTQIIEAGLLARRTAVSSDARVAHHDLWRRLKAENAPFRIVGASGLVSAPITYYDEAILACVTAEWQVGARVVGDTMGELIGRPFAQCAGDMVIWSRVLALSKAGALAIQGSGTGMRECRVRQPIRGG